MDTTTVQSRPNGSKMNEDIRWKRIATAIGTHPGTLFGMLKNPNKAKHCWHWNGGQAKSKPVIYIYGSNNRTGIPVQRFFWSVILGGLDELKDIKVIKACPKNNSLCVNPFHHLLRPDFDFKEEEYKPLPEKYLKLVEKHTWMPQPPKYTSSDQS